VVTRRRRGDRRFDIPCRGLKNFDVARSGSARDDNYRFPKEKDMLRC
jgi:hypothetical protein